MRALPLRGLRCSACAHGASGTFAQGSDLTAAWPAKGLPTESPIFPRRPRQSYHRPGHGTEPSLGTSSPGVAGASSRGLATFSPCHNSPGLAGQLTERTGLRIRPPAWRTQPPPGGETIGVLTNSEWGCWDPAHAPGPLPSASALPQWNSRGAGAHPQERPWGRRAEGECGSSNRALQRGSSGLGGQVV